VRIGEWLHGIVCTFDQPLLNRHVVDGDRFGSVDMELWRFKRRYQFELLGVCFFWRGLYANSNAISQRL
jgi:hypothetical protein